MCKVKCSTADIFNMKWRPVFAYHPDHGLIYGMPDVKKKTWDIYNNGTFVMNCYADCTEHLLTHPHMLQLWGAMEGILDPDDSISDWHPLVESTIRGRIDDHGDINIHDLNHRNHSPFIRDSYKKMVNNAVDRVYRYMGEVLG